MGNIYRGDIYYIEPYQTEGSEQRAGRPAIVVSNDLNNNYSGIAEVVYLTTQPKNDLPTHVIIRSTGRDSIALCEQITTVSRERFGEYICSLTEDEQRRLDLSLMISLAINGVKNETAKNESTTTTSKPEPSIPKAITITSSAPMDMAAHARLEAERDIYKKLYEGLLAQLMPAEKGVIS